MPCVYVRSFPEPKLKSLLFGVLMRTNKTYQTENPYQSVLDAINLALLAFAALVAFSVVTFANDLAPKIVPVSPVIDKDETALVLKAISARYQALGDWEATFTQTEESVGMGTSSYSQGRFSFERPNKFNYSVVQPVASDFISNGKEVWYTRFPDGREKPAYVRHFRSINSIDLNRYLFLLRGIDGSAHKLAELKKDFQLRGTLKGQLIQLEIVPRKASEIAKILLNFENNSEAPKTAIIEDALGNSTTIKIQSHQPLRPDRSKLFTPVFHKDSKIEKL